MAQHSSRDPGPGPASHYESDPTTTQGRGPDRFYTGEERDRARQYAERPHGWGGYESNYGVARGEWRRLDAPDRGSHTGRGPKGYRRRDERTREIICEALTADPCIDASDLEVQVERGEVKLSGTVPDRWTKFAVEELAEECARTGEIRNELRIQQRAAFPWAQSEWPIGS